MTNRWLPDAPILPKRRGAPAQPVRPRCEQKVWINGAGDERWRKGRYGEVDWDRCTRDGRCEIDGHFYCTRHGGEIALARLLGSEDPSL